MRHFASFCVVGIEWLFSAWMLMVVVGVVHGDWLPQVPTIGFGFALLLTGLVSAVLAVRALLSAVVSGLTGDGS